MQANPIQAAFEALKSGKDPEVAAYGTSASPSLVVEETDTSDSDTQEESSEASENATEANAEEAIQATEGQEDSRSEETTTPSSEAIEEILVDAKSGKKVKVDFNDKEKLKRYVQQAHANFKWKTDKDKAEARVKELEPKAAKADEVLPVWNALESAFKEKGDEGVINLLAGDEQAFQKLEARIIARHKRLEEATPEQIALIKKEEEAEIERRTALRYKTQLDDLIAKANQKEEQAKLVALQSRFDGAFSKYRFAGKLGDEVAEHQIDEAIYEKVKSNLGSVPDDSLTDELIAGEFKKVSEAFNKVISKKAEEKVTKTMNKKKVEAQENVTTKAMNGYRTNKDSDDFMNDMRSGNLSSAFARMISGKVKL